MWGAKAGSAALNSIAFVSKISIDSGTIATYNLSKKVKAVRDCRTVSKKDMEFNKAIPEMTVDAETYEVRADGVLQDIPAAERLPLAREYNIF